MMESSPHTKFFLIVLSILISCVLSFPAEDSVTALEKLAYANNEFSMKLHRTLAENSLRNIFFSPTSLFFALGMLYKGAKGQTRVELRNVLGFNEAGLSDEEIDESFNKLLTEIFGSSQNFTLKTANAILMDQRLNLIPQYKQSMENFYHAMVQKVNFQRDRNEIVRQINAWINSQTGGKIPNFLDDLDPSTVMTILNAVYFKGLWSMPFETRDTKFERFYNYGGDAKSNRVVRMMRKSHRMFYASSPDWEMLELPYKGDRISMVIVLPKERDGLAAVEDSLYPDQIREYRSKMKMLTVNLTLPKFKIDSSIDMNRPLEFLGLGNMFRNGANFTGMVQNERVRVSHVMHKALVEVNEEGTVAAAATGVYLVPLSLSVPREFKVDHPFCFVIVDKKSNLILFSGRVIAL
ncbi:leukocyte elastase inhibitor-like isoform X1 [Argiope bruennichi]|uniref:leukocyte elastase inhibitor-like isoform X1 n=1 Tax=Argiope bruennichi TaxID=94029 RepID=UPI00249415C9|nr:leukocyte elastase inhibitor-like isoform X1 [Argiope bruennichi]XP_055949833.1 leukocyte elastase inhibitor-like isoform X1 [Argiope bruennichi]